MKPFHFSLAFLFALVLNASLSASICGVTPAPTVRDSTACDNLTMRDGSELQVKVTVIDQTTIQYKRCDNLDGPVYQIAKSSAFMIKYRNGRKDVFEAANNSASSSSANPPPPPSNQYNQPNPDAGVDGMGIGALILVPIGFFMPILGIGLATLGLAFIMGATAPNRVRNSKGKLRGAGFGIVAAVLSGLILLLVLIALTRM